jgi:hypothetical protein
MRLTPIKLDQRDIGALTPRRLRHLRYNRLARHDDVAQLEHDPSRPLQALLGLVGDEHSQIVGLTIRRFVGQGRAPAGSY